MSIGSTLCCGFFKPKIVDKSTSEISVVFSQPLMAEVAEKKAVVEKTLLEHYGYNAFMTLFQDIPQTIFTIYFMATVGLKESPDNPTGVSLPGYYNLIPQCGNSAAGFAASVVAIKMFRQYYENAAGYTLFNAIIYSIFGLSTVLNGVGNIFTTLTGNDSDEANLTANITTFIALAANFIILFKEELHLLAKMYADKQNKLSWKADAFHLFCSLSLMLSIITSFLATIGWADRNVGAYGYLWGTWVGQVPELVEPTLERLRPERDEEALEQGRALQV